MPRLADILFLLSIGVLLPFYESTWINQNNLPVAQQAEEFELQNQPAPQALPSDYRELEYVENPIPHLDNPAQKLSISFYALGTYFQKLTIPHPLNYYYGYRKIPVVSISHPFVIGSIIVYLALAILTVYFFFRDRKILAFGIGVFLVSILPFSNLISPVAGMVGERLAYVASLGFCIALAYVLLWLFQVDLKRAKPSFAKLPKGFVILVGLLLLSGSFKTIQRNNQWEDSLTLFRNDIRHLRESAQAHNLLASHLVQEANKIQQRREQRKMRQEAIQHFREAVEIHPEFFNPIYDLGRTHLLVGNQQKAKKAFKRAIEVNPDFPNSYLKLANMFYENEDFDKAIPYYQEVIELLPNKVGAFTNLSFIYFRKGEYQKSIEVNQKALHNNPQAVNPRINLGKTYMRMNNNQNAIRYFEEAFELQPNNLNVAKSLAQLHQEQGNNRKANYYKRQARNLSQQGRR
jgi:tetratricopeptide (TPR) repeat protein